MVWTVSDLSVVTNQLIGLLQSSIADFFAENATATPPVAPFTIEVSGSAPDTVRASDGTCQLTLYLLHVRRDPYWRNTTVVTDPVTGISRVTGLPVASAPIPVPPSPPVPPLPSSRQQPLSLNLSYLLTAFAAGAYQQEQQAMSIALRAFHESPIYKASNPAEEFTIQVEADSIEEMSRLWQAVTVPIRLSALFRVAVVFLTPTDPAPSFPSMPTAVQLAVGANLGAGSPPQLFQAGADVTFTNIPSAPPADSAIAVFPPLAFVSQQQVTLGGIVLGGAGLDQVGTGLPFALQLYVPAPSPTATFWDVTNWIVPASPPSPNELRVLLPAGYFLTNPPPGAGTQLTQTPVPGLYTLVIASRTGPPTSSIPLPFAIAALVGGAPATGFPAPLTASGGIFTIQGAGFVPNTALPGPQPTQVALDTVALTWTSNATPGPGMFTVITSGPATGAGTILFALPAPIESGTYFVRVRVNGIESPPNWFVSVP